MNYVEQAIRDAVEKGGWSNHPLASLELVTAKVAWWGQGGNEDQGQWLSEIFLDPAFWQALGKARGWEKSSYNDEFKFLWLTVWHRFIDHLAEGKDAESFFASLSATDEQV